MRVLVVVIDGLMSMAVSVPGLERERDPDGSDRQCDDLHGGDGFSEQCPRDHGTDEWGGGEDHLSSGCPEVSCAFDPQGDREAVADGADDERPDDLLQRDTGGPG